MPPDAETGDAPAAGDATASPQGDADAGGAPATQDGGATGDAASADGGAQGDTADGSDHDADQQDGGVEPPPCDDGNPCTVDEWNGSECVTSPAPDDTPCDDADACTQDDHCVSGSCAGTQMGCPNDGNPCTKVVCDPTVGCIAQPALDDTPCDDGDACTLDDACVDGQCVASVTEQCDDDDPCTADLCDAASGCVHQPLDPCPHTGDGLWARRFGGGGTQRATAVAARPGGGVLAAGTFDTGFGLESTLLDDPVSGESDAWVAAWQPLGDFAWASPIGGAGGEEVVALAPAAGGGVVAVGRFDHTLVAGDVSLSAKGLEDGFLLSLDAQGTPQWGLQAGYTNDDAIEDAVVTSSGKVVAVGSFRTLLEFAGSTFLADDLDGMILTVSADGQPLAAVQVEGPLGTDARAVAAASDGTLVVTGTFHSAVTLGDVELAGAGGIDTFVARLDTDGFVTGGWVVGGAGSEKVSDVAVAADGTVIVTGWYQGNGQFGDGQVEFSNAQSDDVFVAAFDPQGNAAWHRVFGSGKPDYAQALGVAPDGYVTVIGQTEGALPVGATTLTSESNWTIFLFSLDPTGEVAWAQASPGAFEDAVQHLAVDAVGHLFAAGGFEQKTSLGGLTLLSQGGEDIYLYKLAP